MSQRTFSNFPDKRPVEECARKGRETVKSPWNINYENPSALMYTAENRTSPKNESDERSKERFKQAKMDSRRSSWYMRGYKRKTERSFANCHGRTCTGSQGHLLTSTSLADVASTISAPTGRNIVPISLSSSGKATAETSIGRNLEDFPRRPSEPSWRNVFDKASFSPLRDAAEILLTTTTHEYSLNSRNDITNTILFKKEASESGKVTSQDRSGITLFAERPTVPRPPERWIGEQPMQRGTRNPSSEEAGKAAGEPTAPVPSSAIAQVQMPSGPLLSPGDEDRVGNNTNFQQVNGGDMTNSQSDGNEMIGSEVLTVSAHDSSEDEGLCQAMERCLLKMDLCKIIDRMSYADFERMRNSIDTIACFFITVCSPEEQRQILMDTFSKSLEDPTFAAKAGAFYSVIQSVTIDEVPVKIVLLETLRKTVAEWVTESVDKEKSLNAVFLLSEFYYEMVYEDQGINVCGETLIDCLKTLVTEDERDVETLTTCLVINGTRLMEEHANSFQELMNIVRLSLRNSLTSRRYRNHVLFIIDMHHAQFRYLSDDREEFYKRLLGEHTFFGFRRMVPSLAPFFMQSSDSGDGIQELQFISDFSESEVTEKHSQQSDLLSTPENCMSCYQNSLAQNSATGFVPYSISGYGAQVCSYSPVYYSPIMERCLDQEQQLPHEASYTTIPHTDPMNVYMNHAQQRQLYDSYTTNIPGSNLHHSQEGYPISCQYVNRPKFDNGKNIPQQGYPGYEYTHCPMFDCTQVSLQGCPDYGNNNFQNLNYEQVFQQQVPGSPDYDYTNYQNLNWGQVFPQQGPPEGEHANLPNLYWGQVSQQGYPIRYECLCCPLLYYGGDPHHQISQQGHTIGHQNGSC